MTATDPDFDPEPPLGYAPFILWGMLTLWIYTFIRIGRVLESHFAKRRAGFERQPGAKSAETEEHLLKGFHWNRRVTAPCVAGSAVVIALLLFMEYSVDVAGSMPIRTAAWIVAAGSLIFALAALPFMSAVFGALARHERHESLLRGSSSLPDLAARWNDLQSRLVLLSIVSCALFFVPAIGAYQCSLTAAERGFLFRSEWAANAGWAGISLLAGGIFHVWGTAFLLGLINGHFRRETATQAAIPADYLARIDQRLDALERALSGRGSPAEEGVLLRKAVAIARADAPFALAKARQVVERIVERVYLERRPGQPIKPLFNMIEDLTADGAVFPKPIASYLHTVRVVGNIAVHGDGTGGAPLSDSDVELSLLMTLNLVEWYLSGTPK